MGNLEQELESARKQLIGLKEHYSDNLALLRHEVRNPLVSIGAWANRILQTLESNIFLHSEELSELVNKVEDEDTKYRMMSILEKLDKYYAGIQHGSQIVVSETRKAEEVLSCLDSEDIMHDLHRIKKRKLDMMSDVVLPVMLFLAGKVNEKMAVVKYDESMQRGDAVLYADEYKCNILYKNLVSNALEQVPDRGKITFGVEDSGNFLKFNVYNDGNPIPPDSLEKIFEEGESQKGESQK